MRMRCILFGWFGMQSQMLYCVIVGLFIHHRFITDGMRAPSARRMSFMPHGDPSGFHFNTYGPSQPFGEVSFITGRRAHGLRWGMTLAEQRTNGQCQHLQVSPAPLQKPHIELVLLAACVQVTNGI
jgi:hypothetical protein